MTISIMQPYLFPYIGYFQLIQASDIFVIYDDAQYMKGGWINRNRINVNGQPHMFTFGLVHNSHTQAINERTLDKNFDKEKTKFLRTITENYRKAQYFQQTFPLIEGIMCYPDKNLASFIQNSLHEICNFLNINTTFSLSSDIVKTPNSTAEEKVLQICKQFNASQYINVSGGVSLYSHETFNKEKIQLFFIKPRPIEYNQGKDPFIPWLSIIDVLMHNDITVVQSYLNQYELF